MTGSTLGATENNDPLLFVTVNDSVWLTSFAGPTLKQLVRGLNQVGLRPTGIISILQAIKTAGALQADLVIQ